jgi:hypothetical protein
LDLYTKIRYAEETMTLSALDVDYLGSRFTDSGGFLDLGIGRFELETRMHLDSLGSTSNLNMMIEGKFDPRQLRDSLWNDFEAVALMTDIDVNGEQSPDWSLTMGGSQGILRFAGGPQDSIHGLISREMRFDIALSSPLPVKGAVAGRIKDNEVEATFPQVEIDFPLLTLLLGDEVFNFLEGTARGELTLSGLITDPDFYGRLDAKGVRVSFYMAPDTTEKFDTQLLFTEKELYFGVVDTRAGLTQISSEGIIIFSHWAPSSYDLSFWSNDPVGLHLIHDFNSVYADGYARGRVRVRGDWYNTWVDGKLQINYCKITLGEESSYEPEAEVEDFSTAVDMELEAGKAVEFLWPSLTFPVLRTNATRGSKLFIAFDSGSADMSIRGNAALRGGEVFYFDRSFYFKEGTIRFNETQDTFDPIVSFRAEIRERDENDEDVKIILIVENERLSEFSPRFMSEPSKSDIEIIALLGGPIQDQLEESGFGYSALLLSSDIVSQFGILRPFEQSVRYALGLDLFSIRTQVLQNVVFDRLLGIEEPAIVNQPGAVGSYFDNTTIAVGKYIGNDLFLEMLVRFYGGGELGLQTDLLISLEWPTPFFNLVWSISPSLEGLEEVLLNKNTLTFSWLYSY